MVNTLIAWVLVGVFAWVWWLAGTQVAFIADAGDLSDAYWWFTILAAALLAK